MKVLLASSEMHPYSKTGGLADMVGAMAKALAHAGHEVAVVTPLYKGIRKAFADIEPTGDPFEILLGSYKAKGAFYLHKPAPGIEVYLVEQPEFYGRNGVYQENGVVYPDNEHRFMFLSKAVVHLACNGLWQPDIVHVHDWQVSLVPLLIQNATGAEGMHRPRTCLTIHNLAYQGVFPPGVFGMSNLPWNYFNPQGVEFYGQFNFLKSGIVYSDALTTVSPRYAREILTEESGCGLDGVLRARQQSLTGILNGVDYDEWNTENNPALAHPYNVRKMTGKSATKAALQTELGLPVSPASPLFACVTRLTEQKGIDIMLGALEEMACTELQFVLLGSGSPEYERAFKTLESRFPERITVHIGYDNALSHRIEAGADFFLMPSRFEPCGLNQMYSLRYGTIPVVRATGGLDDSVIDATESAESANGIKFYEYNATTLAQAMRKALILYRDPRALRHYRRNGMTANFSWERTIAEYERIYLELLGETKTVSDGQARIV